MKPFLGTGKLLSSDFHPIPFDPALSTILQMHCKYDLSKEVSKWISMKPFLCTGKLSSSSLHPILFDATHSPILQMHCLPYFSTGKLLCSNFHPFPFNPACPTILQMHCQPNLRKEVSQVFSKEVSKVILMKQCLYSSPLPNTPRNLHLIASILQGDGHIVQIELNISQQLMLMKLPYRLYQRWLL